MLVAIGVAMAVLGALSGVDASPLGGPIDWYQYIVAVLVICAGVAVVLVVVSGRSRQIKALKAKRGGPGYDLVFTKKQAD